MNLKIGENLKRLRREKDLTQEELAAHLGISFQAISKWERGESYPDITILPALSNYFKITIDELVGMEEIKREEEYKIGDVCTYLSKDPRYFGIMITHRIIGTDIDENGNKVYVFKGDANYSADQMAVSVNQIYGKVVMRIPKIGYIQYFLSSAYGWIIAIVVPCVGIITFDIIKLITNSKSKRRRRGVRE